MLGYEASRTQPVVKYILVVTIAAYVLQLLPFTGTTLFQWGALVPALAFRHGQIWRLVSYMVLHDPSNPFHLLFNMLALWMFANELEQRWGPRRFLGFYLFSGIGAGMLNLLNLMSPATAITPIIGASGAILGLLTAYAWYFPDRRILVFFVFPLPVRWAVILFGAVSLMFAVQGGGGQIAHLTHLGGILFALIYLKYYDTFEKVLEEQRERAEEKKLRASAEKQTHDRNFFEQTVDPILKKISENGMDSLTPSERKILFKASEQRRRSFQASGILPVDFTKRPRR